MFSLVEPQKLRIETRKRRVSQAKASSGNRPRRARRSRVCDPALHAKKQKIVFTSLETGETARRQLIEGTDVKRCLQIRFMVQRGVYHDAAARAHAFPKMVPRIQEVQ